MSDQEREPEKIQEYRRQHLEPEIAAMSIEIDEDEPPVLIVNIEDNAAKKAIKKLIAWVGTLSGLGGILEWVRRSTGRQVVVAMAGTATVATAATIGVTEVARDEPDSAPPIVAQRIVTLPALPPVTITATATATATPTRAKSTGRAAPPATRSAATLVQPSARPTRASTAPTRAAARTQPPKPKRTRTPARTKTPEPTATRAPDPARTSSQAETDRAETSRGAADESAPATERSSAIPVPTSQPAPPEQTTPPPDPQPTLAAADDRCGGLVRVDLDPLLDLCLLG